MVRYEFSWYDLIFFVVRLFITTLQHIECSTLYLPILHSSLLLFFGSELSQDAASKGLGLVYEMGGEGDQQELVSTLVETLMTGKRWVDEYRENLWKLEFCASRREDIRSELSQAAWTLNACLSVQTEWDTLFQKTQRCSKERAWEKRLMGKLHTTTTRHYFLDFPNVIRKS